MLLWLFEQLADYNSSFQVVRYLTLRSLLSLLTALTIGLVLGPVMIRKLQALKYGQAVSSFAPENHAKKMGTPTMGGILILLSIGISKSSIFSVCATLSCCFAITYKAIPAPNDATEVQKNFFRAGKPALSL